LNGPVTHAPEAVPVDPLMSSRLSRGLVAVVRIGVALLWIDNLAWKDPPTFGQGPSPGGLYGFTQDAVEHPVFPPYSWLVQHLVLPNFHVFAWGVLIVESALGAFLLIGLATRFWALVGIAQTLAITLSAVRAPGEWVWSYLLILMAHAVLFAVAAGRFAGLDGLLRGRWQRSDTRLAHALVLAS
jgi:thiosulfate dehydrogenase [quinone] large subunit